MINSPDPHEGSNICCIVVDTPRNSVTIRWTQDGGVKNIPPSVFSWDVSDRVSCNDNSEKLVVGGEISQGEIIEDEECDCIAEYKLYNIIHIIYNIFKSILYNKTNICIHICSFIYIINVGIMIHHCNSSTATAKENRLLGVCSQGDIARV